MAVCMHASLPMSLIGLLAPYFSGIKPDSKMFVFSKKDFPELPAECLNLIIGFSDRTTWTI